MERFLFDHKPPCSDEIACIIHEGSQFGAHSELVIDEMSI